jgi:acetyl esterase/lipase
MISCPALGGSATAAALSLASLPALSAIAVTPGTASLPAGVTQQYTATGTFTDGSTLDISNTVTWSTGSASTATVTASGLVTAVGPGGTTVKAAQGSVSGSTGLTVTGTALAAIAVTPAIPAVPLGLTQQLSATGRYSDGSSHDITGVVSWSSSSTSVAAVNSQGLATSASVGTATITAALGRVLGSTTLTVTAVAVSVIYVAPGVPSIALGTTRQFTATATMTDGETRDLTAAAQWSSGTSGVATIASGGLATSVGVGVTGITATVGKASDTASLTITNTKVTKITVAPATGSDQAGTSQQFTATGTYSDGSKKDLTAAGYWSSSNGGVATISNTPQTVGLASALKAGSTTITAVVGGVSGSAVLNVPAATLASIAIAPLAPWIGAGVNQHFTATGTYTDQTVEDITSAVTWSSSNASVAVASNGAGSAGLATSAGAGTATITAKLGSIAASTALTVVAPVELSIAPSNPSIFVQGIQPFTATATYSDKSTRDVTGQVAWSSSMPGVASMNEFGLALGLEAGTSTIYAYYAGLNTSALLSVAPPYQQQCEVKLLYGGQQATGNTNYSVCYPTGHATDTSLPAAVFVHAGGWTGGSVGNPCYNAQNISCALAGQGWATYELNYTLATPITSGTLSVQADGHTVSFSTYSLTSTDAGDVITFGASSGHWNGPNGFNLNNINTRANTAYACIQGETYPACPTKINTSGAAATTVQYSLQPAGTMFPQALKDLWCFFDWFGNNAGGSSPHAPGNPNNIYLWGHSAGANLVAMLNFAPKSAFGSTCPSQPEGNWSFTKVTALSELADLYKLYANTDIDPFTGAPVTDSQKVNSAIRDYLGCVPTGTNVCNPEPASPNYWAASYPALAPYYIIAGGLDILVPWQDQYLVVLAAQAFNGYKPGFSIVAGEPHLLDIYASGPNCPWGSACGAGGLGYALMMQFWLASANAPIR